MTDNSIAILPVRIEHCKIPKLLQSKKYADLTESYARGMLELTKAIDYFESLKSNTDFFRAIPTVWAEERILTVDEKLKRSRHWDNFESYVRSLHSKGRRSVQELNTLHYIREYGLTVAELKQQLASLGFFKGPIDNSFTDQLTVALLSFQTANSLRHLDGVFGPMTYLKMAEVARSLGQ